MNTYIFTFITGGIITTLIVYTQINGLPFISRIATLFPVFTWLSYLFIGKFSHSKDIAQHTLFVLLGTLFAWIPYMLFIYFFIDRLGYLKTIIGALLLFIILAIIFSILYKTT